MRPQSSLAEVVNAVSDAVVGMEPIEFLLKDRDVTEVVVSGRDFSSSVEGLRLETRDRGS
jgi:Flp pilus assembly CpaF family ATPase